MRHQIEIKNRSRENQIFEIYLKIGVLEIIWKLEFLKLNTRMRILEINLKGIGISEN